jgi:hypothetical protein
MACDIAKIRDRTLVEHCYKMKKSAKECFLHLQELYPLDGPSRPTVDAYYEKLKENALTLTDLHTGGRTVDKELVNKISKEVTENRYLSLRQLAEKVGSNKTTVARILHNTLGFSRYQANWVPHLLSDEQKKTRVSISKKMLQILSADEKNNFSHILTGDESWFFYEYPFTSYWASPGSPPLTIPNRTVATSKVMFVIFWGVNACPVLSFLPRGVTMNAEQFGKVVVMPLASFNDSFPTGEQIYVHWDNAAPHRAKCTQELVKSLGLFIIPQPPYSPDIAPSDFFLFGMLKQKLKGKECANAVELSQTIQEIMTEITPEKRILVFRNWMKRLDEVIRSEGEYVID